MFYLFSHVLLTRSQRRMGSEQANENHFYFPSDKTKIGEEKSDQGLSACYQFYLLPHTAHLGIYEPKNGEKTYSDIINSHSIVPVLLGKRFLHDTYAPSHSHAQFALSRLHHNTY